MVAAAAAELQCILAAVPVTVVVGCVRGLDLFHGLAAVLVYGIDPRSGHHARPREEQSAPIPLWPVFAGLDRIEPALEQLREGVSAAGGLIHAAGALGA